MPRAYRFCPIQLPLIAVLLLGACASCTCRLFTIRGTVTGLRGTGLVLQNNGGNDLGISSDGAFTFGTAVASGSGYAVTVKTQPTSPSQACTVTNAAGTVSNSAVTDVAVSCVTNTYSIGGTVSGMVGFGLVLQNNLSDDLAVTNDGSFVFTAPVPSGSPYSVTVRTHSTAPMQNCTATRHTGVVGASNVADVLVTCATAPYYAINYYPKDHAWLAFWSRWPQARSAMLLDMPNVRTLGANTVRLFVHPAAFGWPSEGLPGVPDAAQLDRIDEALSILDQNGLKARLCLFDLFDDFAMIQESVAWMTPLMNRFRDDPRIAMWELKNEVNMFSAPGVPDTTVTIWVDAVLPEFKRLAARIPVSVSISAASNYQGVWRDNLRGLVSRSVRPDYYDVHFYPLDELRWTWPLEAHIREAVTIVGDAGMVLLHELGQTTWGRYPEDAQRDVLQSLFHHGLDAGIRDFGVWVYTDFPDGTLVGTNDASAENEYGLYRLDGGAKPAASAVSDMFHGLAPALPPQVLYNPSFEHVSDRGVPTLKAWIPWTQSGGWYDGELVRDSSQTRDGEYSARLTTKAGDVAGFFCLPGWPVAPGQTVSATGSAWLGDLPAGSIVHLAISWFGANANDWKGNSDGAAAVNDGGWASISVMGEAPNGAQYLQIFAKVACQESNRHVWFDGFTATLP